MSVLVTVRHTAEAAHRIPVLDGAGAKCRNLHGHSWQLEWTFDATGIDVEHIEFGAIKTVLRGWVDEHFDHGFVGHYDDPYLMAAREDGLKVWELDTWPTTEAIATELAAVTCRLLPELRLVAVKVQEGSSNQALWTSDLHGATA